MRTILLLTMLSAPALAGEPILVPSFTPATASEIALAAMVEELVSIEFARDGHVILTSEAVRPVVGDIIDRCAERQGCPYAPLQKLPTRFAVVVGVARNEDGGLVGTVEFYEQADPTPIAMRELTIEPGNEEAFAVEIRHQTNDLIQLLGPASAEDLLRAVRLVEGTPETAPPEPQLAPQPAPPAPAPAPEPAPEPLPVEPEPEPLVGTPMERKLAGSKVQERHVRGNDDHFLRYEGTADEWVFKMTPHAGRFFVEVRGGVGVGDVSRRADVRLITGGVVTEWFQEGPEPGFGVRAGLGAGYAPVTWCDLGVVVEVQTGTKTLTTAFDDGPQGTAVASATQALVQPRARFYLAPLGPVKPAVFVGGEARMFDAYRIEPNPDLFPEPPGGIIPGAVGGIGLVVDPVPVVGMVLEGAYTHHFGIRSAAAQDGRPPEFPVPVAPKGNGMTVAISGALQFRI